MSIRSLANTTNLSTQKFSARRVSSSANLSSKKFNVRSIISPVQGYFVTISPAYNGNTTIDLTTANITLANSGTWTIVPLVTFAVNIAMWGAGGQTASAGTGGAGGYSHGTITFNSGTSYTIRVGSFDGGGTGTGRGGGYTGVFSGTETFANSVIIAGGGGGAPPYYNSPQNGGAGGGSSGQASNGGAGTQSAGGAGGNAGNAGSLGSAGGQLSGGAGSIGPGVAGGGGGSGYYGGGGGGGRAGGDGIGGGGGGGSGYLHPSLVSNGNTQVGSAGTAANSASGLRGTSGNADSNGKIILLRAL
jgi:hypothetical protein